MATVKPHGWVHAALGVGTPRSFIALLNSYERLLTEIVLNPDQPCRFPNNFELVDFAQRLADI